VTFIDERFLMHRLRSTSTAGILCALLAILLFAWHFYRDQVWSWDLVAVAGTFIVIKYALLIWYRTRD
jgi:hypothetical protein